MKAFLPSPESTKITDYSSAMDYASYDGAFRAQYSLYLKRNMNLLAIYEGYAFVRLSAMCDPYIFCNQVNKYCLRYVATGLLPAEIVADKIKHANPGMRLSTVLKLGDNAQQLVNYISGHNSVLVNTTELLKRLLIGRFDHSEFLALSLLVFENIISNKYGLSLQF